jgi:hypothetical protein
MALGTVIYAGTYLATLAVLEYLQITRQLLPLWPTVQNIVVPALVYNTTLMILLLPLLNRVPESQDL